MKNSNDTIGIRTRDLPACSAVSQSTAPTRMECHFPVAISRSKDRHYATGQVSFISRQISKNADVPRTKYITH
jgi:hypothetical protein